MTAATPAKISGTTSADAEYLTKWFKHTNGRLTYYGPKRLFGLYATLGWSPDSQNAVELQAGFGFNGVWEGRSKITSKSSRFGDIFLISLNSIREMERGDYVELWAISDLTTGVTFPNAILEIVG